MGTKRRSRLERPTDQPAITVRSYPIKLDMLTWLRWLRMATNEQLARCTGRSVHTIRSNATQMFGHEWVHQPPLDRQDGSYLFSGPVVNLLGERGARFLEDQLDIALPKTQWNSYAKRRSIENTRHTLMRSEIVSRLQAGRGRYRIRYHWDVLDTENEKQPYRLDNWREMGWDIPGHVLNGKAYKGTWLFPDMITAVIDPDRPEGRNKKWFTWEFDTDSEGNITTNGRDLETKFRKYKHLFDNHLYTEKYGSNMRMVFVTTGKSRKIKNTIAVLNNVGLNPNQVLLINYDDLLDYPNIFEAEFLNLEEKSTPLI